ncbi:MAG TPA: hypothetical protein VHX49_13675 [Candidatus Acidoferrales bacterium]|jgi:hypothetical protein|nr:hypothetical protein [Candidatus Acidoferrales bacterium]
MRRTLRVCAAVLVFAAGGWIARAQQDQTSSQASQTAAPTPAAAPQQDSLAEAARKAREQKKDAPKAAKVFTNDDIPTQGAVSTVGTSDTDTSQNAQDTSNAAAAPAASGNDEKMWRDKFADLNHKLAQDQAELDVLQREANTGMLQYYGGDPQKAFQDQTNQQPLGAAYDKKVAAIDAKKKEIEADQQAISDAEDDLHKAGGDPGWAR